MWFLYNILFVVGYLVLLPHFLVRMCRRGGYRRNFRERFGAYRETKQIALSQGARIWVHAVSVGEAQLALALIEALLQEDTTLQFVISTTTSTGYALLETRKRPDDVLIYYPVDFPWVVRRVVDLLQPQALVLLECELWPNLLRELARRKVPVWVVNGRVSERSFRGYRKVSLFFRRAAGMVTGFLVQTETDAQRLRLLGAERVQVIGSAKFDLPLPREAEKEQALSVIRQAGMDPSGLFWVMGSTWPGEEAGLLEVFRALRQQHPGLQAILVPRHAERGNEVQRLLQASGLPYVRRTTLPAEPPDAPPAILLADSTGELAGYYMLAHVVFVGKSMGENHGGQNPVEPAALGKAVVTGPNMENFPGVMEDLLAADGILVVPDFPELEQTCRKLLADTAYCVALGERAAAVVASRRGVMFKSARMIVQQFREAQR